MAAHLNANESEQYDRQIRLWGVEAQRSIQASKILIWGMGGLGAETVKNLVLAGLSATIADDATVRWCTDPLIHPSIRPRGWVPASTHTHTARTRARKCVV